MRQASDWHPTAHYTIHITPDPTLPDQTCTARGRNPPESNSHGPVQRQSRRLPAGRASSRPAEADGVSGVGAEGAGVPVLLSRAQVRPESVHSTAADDSTSAGCRLYYPPAHSVQVVSLRPGQVGPQSVRLRPAVCPSRRRTGRPSATAAAAAAAVAAAVRYRRLRRLPAVP